jgi:hypothetical protein
MAVTCRAPSGQSQGVATPRVEPSNLGLPEAGARASDGGVNDATIAPASPEEVPIERLIVEAAAYFGRRVTTTGWVVSCAAAIICKMIKCGSCGGEVSRCSVWTADSRLTPRSRARAVPP